MKAIRVHKHGGPDVLTLEDVEIGKPGPREILVRNRAIGVNFVDTYLRSGTFSPPSLPFILARRPRARSSPLARASPVSVLGTAWRWSRLLVRTPSGPSFPNTSWSIWNWRARNACDHVIDYRHEDFAARIRELTAGE